MGNKNFSDEQIAILSKDPNVRDVRPNRLRFTLKFRQEMYDAVKDDIRQPTIWKFLIDHGYSRKLIKKSIVSTLSIDFKQHGRPKNENRTATSKMYHHDKSDDEVLLKTGKFKRARTGIRFTDEFINELYHNYPDVSIEDGIRNAGIDPDLVGYQRITQLKRRFDNYESIRQKAHYSDAIIGKYRNHPYVKRITRKQFVLKPAFYNEVQDLSDIDIDDLLDVYHLDHNDFSIEFRNNLKYRISCWKKNDDKQTDSSSLTLQIQNHRMKLLEKELKDRLKDDGKNWASMNWSDKKELCCMIYFMPEDSEKQYSINWYLKMTGIPRSSYYSILRNDDYGTYARKKEEQDQKDIVVIRQVIDYKGFKKGSRQIYMDMKDITGEQFGIKKIRRLMKKAGIMTDIRVKNASRRSAQALLKRNKKPNLLKRQFHLMKPNQVRLTDVTYLDYGNGERAYGSAVKDPVTGKCIDFTVSEFNDLDLVLTSLKQISFCPLTEDSILHSDQGALYLTDTFQNEAAALGMNQSMSKRGNCWDNAPQESFFGHMKDEVDYKNCKTLEELKTLMAEYKDYYNNERHQWNLNRMTPVQYEQYLLHLTPEQEAQRVEKEQKKYDQMKRRAEQEAKVRAQTLGV